jgi:transposase
MSRAIVANRSQRFLLPPDLDEWVGPRHPVRFIADLVDALDLAELGFRMSPGEDGRPHFAAEMLLAVWLYGWMERIRSSRGLEKAVRTQVAFMWLTGQEQPDHVTLWRFFRDNRKALPKLFKAVVRTAAKMGLVGFALHALDGTKLSAACSTETATHRKSLEDELKKLDAIVDASVVEVEANEAAPSPDWEMPEGMQDREKRKAEIKAELKTLEEAGTNHLHPKEPDARMVKTRDGLKLGYNAQIVVDHDSDLIVAANVVNEATDHLQLVPMVAEVVAVIGAHADETVADKGYASGEQFQEAERRHLPVLVDVQEESSEKGAYAKSKFTYDAERNVYTCPRGEELPLVGVNNATTGKPAMQVYRCGNRTCPVKASCTTDKSGRSIKRRDGEDAVDRQVAKMALAKNRVLYGLRKEIVEHLFGIIKTIDGFRRFTVRGLEGSNAQWSLVCLAVNLRKLLPAVRERRLSPADFRRAA